MKKLTAEQYKEAMKMAKELPQDSNTPIYQDFNGNGLASYLCDVCYSEEPPTTPAYFFSYCRKRRARGGFYILRTSKLDENGNVLPKKQYRSYVTYHKKWARKEILVTGVTYDIVGIKRRSAKLPPAVLLSNVKFILAN